MKQKTCTKCDEAKPATSEYFYCDKRNKNGITAECKKCATIRSRKWREKSNYKTPKSYYRKHNLKRLYSITIEDYDKMYFRQNGVCMTCGRPETAENQYGIRRLAVDHDHKTGKVRGLLCTCCNRLIGLARDDINTLKRIIEYLEEN